MPPRIMGGTYTKIVPIGEVIAILGVRLLVCGRPNLS
jgi:hypothetical protein